MKRFWVFIAIVILGGVVFFERTAIRDLVSSVSKEPLPIAVTYREASGQPTSTVKDVVDVQRPAPQTAPAPTANTNKPLVTVTNKALNLAVPFQSQAPFGDWSEPYENGCEEASIIMVDYYLRAASLSNQQMKDAIDAQVAWQVQNWNGHEDLSIEKVVELAKAFYPDYTMQILPNLTPETIKQQLVLGRPVIAPSAGRELGNPNFRGQGPLYHMLVVKGYTADGKFITNDPGTRNGADYVYTSSVLMNAINDWGKTGLSGEKTGLVMYK
ncbi:MAG: C39 family peptidase [Candidatus Komeilibacteria bacterium]|nr:C39 family peptidase [Candidatus Komeilibacteria bacterium]